MMRSYSVRIVGGFLFLGNSKRAANSSKNRLAWLWKIAYDSCDLEDVKTANLAVFGRNCSDGATNWIADDAKFGASVLPNIFNIFPRIECNLR